MSLVRRHDLYVGRAFLSTLAAAVAILSALVIVYDIAERVDKLSKAAALLAREPGRNPKALLVEYYATLLPFLWMKLLPTACLLAGALTITWFARQNELVPLVTSGIPTRRILAPIFVVAFGVVLVLSVARETVVPGLSRRHDDLHRLFSDPGRNPDQIHDVGHFDDVGGGRLSLATFVLSTKRIESAYLVFRHDPTASGRTVVLRYPILDWDPAAKRWTAPRGGERRVLEPVETGADVTPIAASEPVPFRADPRLLELRIRQGVAMGLSSAEIRELAAASPDDASRFALLLHRQWAAPFGTIVMLLLGLPFAFRLGRRRPVFRAFGMTMGLVAGYVFADSVTTDMGARGALNPLVAAWGAHVVFGALGLTLLSGIET